MTKEYLEFHVKELIPDCHEWERQQLIEWLWDEFNKQEEK